MMPDIQSEVVLLIQSREKGASIKSRQWQDDGGDGPGRTFLFLTFFLAKIVLLHQSFSIALQSAREGAVMTSEPKIPLPMKYST